MFTKRASAIRSRSDAIRTGAALRKTFSAIITDPRFDPDFTQKCNFSFKEAVCSANKVKFVASAAVNLHPCIGCVYSLKRAVVAPTQTLKDCIQLFTRPSNSDYYPK